MNSDNIFAGVGSIAETAQAGSVRLSKKQTVAEWEIPSYHAELIMARLDELLMHTKTYLTIEECARYLSLSIPTVRRLIYDGELPFSRPSKRIYVAKKDLDDFIAKNRYDSESETATKASNYIVSKH